MNVPLFYLHLAADPDRREGGEGGAQVHATLLPLPPVLLLLLLRPPDGAAGVQEGPGQGVNQASAYI